MGMKGCFKMKEGDPLKDRRGDRRRDRRRDRRTERAGYATVTLRR